MLKKIFSILASSIIATGLVSCSTDNSPKPQPMPKIFTMAVLNQGWTQTAPMPSAAGSFVPTITVDSAIWTADSGGYIYKIDPSDGSLITKFYIRHDLSSGVGVAGSLVFVTTMDGNLLAIDKGNGKVRWQASLPTVSLEAPQAAGDIVLVRTNDAELLAFNVSDGSPVWIYQKQIPPLTLRVNNSFQIIGNEVVAVGLPGGKLALLNLRTGAPITDLDKITDIGMRPLIDNKTLYVGTYNGKLAGLDAVSSSILWQKKFSTAYGLAVDEQNLYAISQDGIVYAFDKVTGAQVWQNDTLQYRNLSTPAILGNGVIVVDNDGYEHMFNRNNGQEIARVNTLLEGGVSYPLVRDNGIIYQSANGYIVQIKNY